MPKRSRHLLSAYERLRIGAVLHTLAAAAQSEDPKLADKAHRWAALARRRGFLWEDELETIRTALDRYNLIRSHEGVRETLQPDERANTPPEKHPIGLPQRPLPPS